MVAALADAISAQALGVDEDGVIAGGILTGRPTRADLFVYATGNGGVHIADYDIKLSMERIDLRGVASATRFEALSITSSRSGAVMDFGRGDTLTLDGIDASQLNKRDFIFAGQAKPNEFLLSGVTTDNFQTTASDDIFVAARDLRLASSDTIRAGAGYDRIVVEYSGNDVYMGESRFAGVSGVDELDVSAPTNSLRIYLNADIIGKADDGSMLVYSGANDMTLTTGGAMVEVEGSGEVMLRKGGGVRLAGNGDGHVTGGVGDQAGVDTIIGGAGNDTLSGGDRGDLIEGGAGNDVLSGGSGADRFVFSKGGGADRITDFNIADILEKIDLRGMTGVDGLEDIAITQSKPVAGRSDAVLSFRSGEKLTLEGVDGSKLKASEFVFGPGPESKEISIAAGTSGDLIQAAIDEATRKGMKGTVFRLDEGEFTFKKAIVIEGDGISLLGKGSDKTKIKLDTSSGNASAILVGRYIDPDDKADSSLRSASKLDAYKITLASEIVGLKAGDVIRISQPNDTKWGYERNDGTVIGPQEKRALRTVLAEVEAVKGREVTLTEKLPFAFAAGSAVHLRDIIKDVKIGGFSVTTSGLGKLPGPDERINSRPDFVKEAAIKVRNAGSGVELNDIKVTNAASSAFAMESIIGVKGDQLWTDGAYNKDDSEGYGFSFDKAFGNEFTNLVSMNMRHGVLFSAWGAEHNNIVQVNKTNADINFHGGPDSGNKVTVIDLDISAKTQNTSAVAVGEGQHPKTNIDLNTVRFVAFKGGIANDKAQALDKNAAMSFRGAEMSGGLGNDTLDGGNGGDTLQGDKGRDTLSGNDGDDILEGGTDTDTLSGGAGKDRLSGGAGDDDKLTGGGNADIFAFGRADGRDGVTDFQVKEGDKVDLSGTGVSAFDQLALRQDGRGTVLLSLGQGASLALKGVPSLDALTSSSFIFSKKVATSEPIQLFDTDKGASGTAADDTFIISASFLGDERYDIVGGAGTDTLVLTGRDGIRVSAENLAGINGIEVLDVSQRKATVSLDKTVVDQSDGKKDGGKGDELIIKVKAGGDDIQLQLNTRDIKDADAVQIDGDGRVKLSDVGGVVSSAGGKVDILGGSGDDTIVGKSAADTLDGGRGDDKISGNGGNDDLAGGGGADRLSGGGDKDTLDGGTGEDVLDGGAGKDTLTGGKDADTFIFTSADGDRITDFKQGFDHLQFDASSFNDLGKLKLGQNFFSSSDAGPLKAVATLFFDADSHKLFFDEDGTGKARAEVVAEFDASVSNLGVSDFFAHI